VQSLSGTLDYQFQDECDFCVIDSDMQMSIAWPEAVRNTRRTMLLSEAKDDSAASFVVTETEQMRDGRRETSPSSDIVEGRIELSASGTGELFVKGEDKPSQVPEGTVLTTRHLQDMVSAAEKGTRFVSRTVLDPALEDHIALVTGFILGPTEDGRLEGLGRAWRMRLAFFPLNGDGADAEPDYELAIVMSETGVVSSFVQYIDALEVSGELSALEQLEPLSCK